MVVVALVVGVISWFSLVTASRRAYRRAALQSLRALTSNESAIAIQALARGPSPVAEIMIGVVSSSTPAFGLDIDDARAAALSPDRDRAFVAIPVDVPGEEIYVVGLFDSTVPTSIALVEVSRMTPFVLLGALGCAGLLVIMAGRVLLPPLDVLRQAAVETRPVDSNDALAVAAPNEILEVAQRFRHTIRQLNHEREVVEAQRDELTRMQENLIRASKLASVGRLAAGIAHEIGNPLAAVQGYLSLLKSGLPDAQADDVLDRSRAELQRIHQTIQKLLTYARTGEERPVQPGPFGVEAALNEAVALARGHPALRGVDLSIRVGSTPLAHGHAGHFHQVIVNLLLNAGQALAHRTDGRIDISVQATDETIAVSVTDNGVGVPDDNKEVIFDPFYTTKDTGQGTGLGLAVSRSLMEAVGGDLTVHDADGGGAAFVVTVPRAPS